MEQKILTGKFLFFYCFYISDKLLQPEQGYSLFKAGVRPDWGDERNAKGGRWLIKSCSQLDNTWKEIAMMLVGFTLDPKLDDAVNGAVVNVRGKWSNIAVWLSDNSLANAAKEQLLSLLGESERHFEYRLHNKEL